MFVETVRIESLANNSYVVGSEQSGRCIVIDPARDIDQYVQIAANHGTRIVYAFETHVHNDFVSGARELADQIGCQVAASASGGLLFPSVRLQQGDKFDLGDYLGRKFSANLIPYEACCRVASRRPMGPPRRGKISC